MRIDCSNYAAFINTIFTKSQILDLILEYLMIFVVVDHWVAFVCNIVAKSCDNIPVALMFLLYYICSYLNPVIPCLLAHVPTQVRAYVDAQSI